MSSKKPPHINMVCQVDSSEHMSLPDKNHKISGTASIRLHKESGSLAVVRADNQLAVLNLNKLDSEPFKILASD